MFISFLFSPFFFLKKKKTFCRSSNFLFLMSLFPSLSFFPYFIPLSLSFLISFFIYLDLLFSSFISFIFYLLCLSKMISPLSPAFFHHLHVCFVISFFLSPFFLYYFFFFFIIFLDLLLFCYLFCFQYLPIPIFLFRFFS